MHFKRSVPVHDSSLCSIAAVQVEGLHIRVDRAGQSAHGSAGGSVMYERNRTVFVGNLPFDVEVQHYLPVTCTF